MSSSNEPEPIWHRRAARLLDEARERIGTDDVIPQVSAALACLQILYGERPPEIMDGYAFPGEPCDESGCTCPPDLLARGGFSGQCPVHGVGSMPNGRPKSTTEDPEPQS